MTASVIKKRRAVLVDKPAVPTSAQAIELGALARERGLVLYCFQNRRWDSDFLTLVEILSRPPGSAGHLGEIIDYEAQ